MRTCHTLAATALSILMMGCATAPVAPAVRETAAVAAEGDAADDPAIWVAPNPGESLVLATQKQGGIYVFDLSGAIVQEAPGGRPNNIDLRDGFAWTQGVAPIVGASDRSDNAIVLWRFDAAAARLEPQARARIATGFAEVYGFCLGRLGADYVALATDKNTGEVGVWRLVANAEGGVGAERIAAFTLGSIAEGCVIDDAQGVAYISQELVGVWRADLHDGGASRALIDQVRPGGALVADVEGLTIWRRGERAFLIASVQGRSQFAVYDLAAGGGYLGAFMIGPSGDARADGVQGTDGVDVTSAALGADFPDGLLVAQDDANTDPADLQNFKYVSWADVVAALGLN